MCVLGVFSAQILGVSRAYFRFSRAYGSILISCIFFLACFYNLVHFNKFTLKLSTFAGMAKKHVF